MDNKLQWEKRERAEAEKGGHDVNMRCCVRGCGGMHALAVGGGSVAERGKLGGAWNDMVEYRQGL